MASSRVIDQADTVRRIPRTLEAMAGSLNRLLGFFVADPEMSGDAVHHDPLAASVRVCLSAVSPLIASQNRSVRLGRLRGLFGIRTIGARATICGWDRWNWAQPARADPRASK
jgi:hypothetical protein